jgi:hypothetical protein
VIIGNYKVKWTQWGWSYAKPIVYARRASILRFVSPWEKVWVGPTRLYVRAEKMYPNELRSWFNEAIKEYEDYAKAWSEG